MIIILGLILFLLFLFVSVIHFYWLFGGNWKVYLLVPTVSDRVKPRRPKKSILLIMAIVFFLMALFIIFKLNNYPLPKFLSDSGLWIMMTLFIFRAIGDFNYVGLFKEINSTKFARRDTKYISPLSLLLGLICMILASVL